MYLSFYCKGSKRVTQDFTVRGSWGPNIPAIYRPPLLRPSALCLSRFPGLLNRRPRGPALCWKMAFFTASYHQLVSKTPSGVPRAPSAGCGFPYHNLVSGVSDPQLSDFLSRPSYIIVQRPLNLWNGMFDRHKAEITVMQFRGPSLPVHQSMSVSWAFTLSHFISQIRRRDFFRLLAIGMCNFLPVHHFGMACLPGPKVNI